MRLLIFALAASSAWPQGARFGNYEVTLRLPPEGLTAQEEMQIEYKVADATRIDPVMGAVPVIRAAARSVIEMPSMPSMAKLIEAAHPEGVPGEYGVHPVFPHGGEYRLLLYIRPPGGAEFEASFPLQVGDARRGGKPKPRPYYAEVRSAPKTPKAGDPAELSILVKSRVPGASPVVTAFDIQHEKPMHLIVVRSDLGEFAHEHPDPGPGGEFRIRYVFPSAGDYTLFVDAAPKGAGGQVMPVRMKVSGPRPKRVDIAALPLQRLAVDANLTAEFSADRFPAARTQRLECVVKLQGKAARFEPYLGALGHLILVNEDAETFVHSHPDELDPRAGEDGRIAFLARFPKPGRYRGWVQVQSGGRLYSAPFVVEATAN
ncbi:MAG: hypothetical protein FJW30_23615 [Acidobacteria bacterium]|nr:hypothetical protein [Acidobacteriota bacterium]